MTASNHDTVSLANVSSRLMRGQRNGHDDDQALHDILRHQRQMQEEQRCLAL